MLQFVIRRQLINIKSQWSYESVRSIAEVKYLPPIKVTVNQVTKLMEYLPPRAKHWFIGGDRSLAVGIKLLKEKKVIAVPTDTIYGLAALAQDTECVEKLYEIKGRDKSKPFAIAVNSITDIKYWGEVEHIPANLLLALLPGQVTIVIKRKPTLNPKLNPGIDTIGVRVTDSKFVRSLAKILNAPLALTSANRSNEKSSLTAEEFSELWPSIDGIFYTIPDKRKLDEKYRAGSTIVDLTVPNKYKIIRPGIVLHRVRRFLHLYGYTPMES
ncbi:threonylcarbamoyl-AMP synthase [Microplitis mediator]|uniref:threonylcarbamoyl-AMP synthase n=1 Tax=Microplitis mediator TaxID=375433 RepID=UPI002557ADBF|nr:threonylcarbamoyl-AMP synthase [Microplitis mediator]XP_057322757.1 threonylcarbamoyl-AMP synthase [Microplitis mediator]XP_057322758.1 threonylcarbamoyl-AMP synthase [Microplitis mediator]XP_057322759.1 threonylcarbamoyl-AMP synthase [Microplitis mediator]XP_057322760.1 threonylcarbamoyl-AMP synthase [Microplitis mediator]